jgi:NAD(P)-dependent dehydrogenase (short-subunit alcohol dehydrogenase family)
MRVRTVPSRHLSKTREAEPTAKLSPAYNDAMKNLNNRVALVTGGSRGIGAAVAIALSRAGANLAVNFRERADAANAVCAEITQMGRKAIAIQADVSVSADVRRMVAVVEAQLGGIDILVNNAYRSSAQIGRDHGKGMGRSAHGQPEVGVLGDAGCDRWNAAKKMGTHHQSVLSRSTDGRGSGGAKRQFRRS